MCGIFAYLGAAKASEEILSGLKRLEYRGYDSWGLSVIDEERIVTRKTVGAIGELNALHSFPSVHKANVDQNHPSPRSLGIGHTRWATHGVVTQVNAHPHNSRDASFSIVHNGIVENYAELQEELLTCGHSFTTQTDTEVIVRLIEQELTNKERPTLKAAMISAFEQLSGRNGLVLLSREENRIYAIKNGSPLILGIGDDEMFIASDSLSFAEKTNSVIFIEDLELIDCGLDSFTIYDTSNDTISKRQTEILEQTDGEISKSNYPHFMLKEIMEQKTSVLRAVEQDFEEIDRLVEEVRKVERVFTCGAGGAYFTAGQIAYALRTIANIPAQVVSAYEIDSFTPHLKQGDLLIAVSQSGETADTLDAVAVAKEQGLQIASLVNMNASSLARFSDYSFSNNSGPEICVLSTKTSTAQMLFGYSLAHKATGDRSNLNAELARLDTKLSAYLSESLLQETQLLADELSECESLYIVGKGQNFFPAQIAALNIKEASYIHAEAFAGGEFKHGVIALIEEGVPVIVFIDDDKDASYMQSVANEVKSRGATVIGVSPSSNPIFDYHLPLLPKRNCTIATACNIIPCQLLAYYLAVNRGHNPDRPRNLAKSVTVR